MFIRMLGLLTLILPGVILAGAQSRLVVTDNQHWDTVKTYENSEQVLNRGMALASLTPTHVVRFVGDVSSAGMNCDDVNHMVDQELIQPIMKGDFSYMGLTMCAYNEQKIAKSLYVSFVFDPLTPEDLETLAQYIATNDNRVLFGQTFHVEKAKGTTVLLTLQAGLRKDIYDEQFIMLAQSKKFKFFPTYVESLAFNRDTRERFYSEKPGVVQGFLGDWFGPFESGHYGNILRKSTYAELNPDKVMIMEAGEPLHTPLQLYFAHWCQTTPTGHCL